MRRLRHCFFFFKVGDGSHNRGGGGGGSWSAFKCASQAETSLWRRPMRLSPKQQTGLGLLVQNKR